MQKLLQRILKDFRRRLGASCIYLAFESSKDDLFLVAHLNNELGGVDKVRQKLGKTVDDSTLEDFENMFRVLNFRQYTKSNDYVS